MEGATIEGNLPDVIEVSVERELEQLSAALEARRIISAGTNAHRSIRLAYAALREAGTHKNEQYRRKTPKKSGLITGDLTLIVCLQNKFIETSPAGFKAIVSEGIQIPDSVSLYNKRNLTKLLEEEHFLSPFLVTDTTITRGGIMLPGVSSLERYKEAVGIPRDYNLGVFLGYEPDRQQPTAEIKRALIATYFLGDGVAVLSFIRGTQNTSIQDISDELMVFHGGFLVFSSKPARYMHWPQTTARPGRRLTCSRLDLEKRLASERAAVSYHAPAHLTDLISEDSSGFDEQQQLADSLGSPSDNTVQREDVYSR